MCLLTRNVLGSFTFFTHHHDLRNQWLYGSSRGQNTNVVMLKNTSVKTVTQTHTLLIREPELGSNAPDRWATKRTQKKLSFLWCLLSAFAKLLQSNTLYLTYIRKKKTIFKIYYSTEGRTEETQGKSCSQQTDLGWRGKQNAKQMIRIKGTRN